MKSFENYVLKSSLFFMWCVFYLFATFTAKIFEKHAFGITVSLDPSVCPDARTYGLRNRFIKFAVGRLS
jgi:hypothetical protein